MQTQDSGSRPANARPRTSKLTSRPYVLIAIAILFTGIYGLDYSAGRDLSLWLLYIVPIALGTFAMGPRCGIVLSCLAGTLLFLNGYLLGNPYASTVAFVVDRTSALLAYLLIAGLIDVARRQYEAFLEEIAHISELPE